MLKFHQDLIPAIKSIRALLDTTRYDAVQKAIRGFQYFLDPWPNFKEFEKRVESVPDPLRTCFELLLLGKTIARQRLLEMLPADHADVLLDCNFLIEDDRQGVRTDSLCIISYLDHYFVAELPYFYPTCVRKNTMVYMGADSYWLAHNHVADSCQKTLDLCTGTGIQAILSSISGQRVVAVDISDEAINAARFNVVLNNGEEKIEVRRGHLYAAVKGETFDLIYANPPFLPVPEGVEYPLAGDGGRDGLRVLGEIIDGLETHLNPHGQAIIISEVIGNREGPFLSERLSEMVHEKGWDVLVTLRDALPLFYQAHMIARLTSQIYEREKELEELVGMWKALYRDINAEYLYPVIIFVRKQTGGAFRIVKPFQRWHVSDRPVVSSSFSFQEAVSSYVVKQNNGRQIGEIDKETYDFLEFCDGRHRIEDIVMQLFPKYRDRYKHQGIDKALNDAMQVCDTLERMGVLTVQRVS
jgi:methylase of polypeptide subunit release factors